MTALFISLIALGVAAVPHYRDSRVEGGPDPKPIIQAKCARCHSGANPAAGLDLSGDLDSIAKSNSISRGQPHNSRFFTLVNDGRMPKGDSKLSDSDIQVIRDWITSLRPDPTAMFASKCMPCHSADHHAGGLVLSGDIKELSKLKETVGDTPADAALYKRVADGTMPKNGTPLNPVELAFVKDFVASTHPNPQPIFQAKCIGCHGSSSPAAGLDLTVSLDSLSSVKSVVKGMPANSALYNRIADGSMPRGGKRLSDSEVGLVWDWIASLKPPKASEN